MSQIEAKIIQGDCLEVLRTLPSESVQTCITSPPYFGLRDYGAEGQIGLEKTLFEYISKLVEVFNEVRRVLKNDGTFWLNIGDSYSNFKDCKSTGQTLAKGTSRAEAHVIEKGLSYTRDTKLLKAQGFKNKELMGVPWRLAFALSDSGWYLRQDIIWSKPNPMPESVTDRCTKSHEYIFLLTKSSRYYYDQESIKEPLKDTSMARLIQDVENQEGSSRVPGKTNGKMKAVKFGGNNLCPDTRLQSGKEWNPKMAGGGSGVNGHSGYFDADGQPLCGITANKKSVWTVTTKGYKDAHFATFPEKLIEPCVLAGSRVGDTVLDPFNGACTTGLVALKHRRNYIGIELNPDYVKLSEKRLRNLQTKLF